MIVKAVLDPSPDLAAELAILLAVGDALITVVTLVGKLTARPGPTEGTREGDES